MATDEDLQEIVGEFRDAEGALRDIVDRAKDLHTAAAALEVTRDNVLDASSAVGDGGRALEATSLQLGTLASQLASATEALEKTDPEGLLREIARLGDQIERLRSRVDETNAEQRTRLEATEKSLQEDFASIVSQLDDISTLTDSRFDRIGRTLKWAMAVTIPLLAAILILALMQQAG